MKILLVILFFIKVLSFDNQFYSFCVLKTDYCVGVSTGNIVPSNTTNLRLQLKSLKKNDEQNTSLFKLYFQFNFFYVWRLIRFRLFILSYYFISVLNLFFEGLLASQSELLCEKHDNSSEGEHEQFHQPLSTMHKDHTSNSRYRSNARPFVCFVCSLPSFRKLWLVAV